MQKAGETMAKVYFEEIHKAAPDYPYIDRSMSDINYIAHYHEDLELAYVTSGETSAVVDGTEIRLCRGDICLIMPGEIHSFSSEAPNELYIMKFSVPAEFLSIRTERKLTEHHLCYPKFHAIIKTIAKEDKERNNGYRYAVRAQTEQLQLEIIRALHTSYISENETKETTKKIALLRRVCRYVEDHYTQSISLDEIARHCHYSKYYFAHMFKEITSTGFSAYLMAFRLEKARSLLEAGESITDAALNCGFNSLRSFHRGFRQHYGTSPLSYQKENHGQQKEIIL